MSKITLTPHASGSGTLNIAAPNTNSTRTLTLPDADLNLGNVLTTSSSVDAANLTGALPAISGAALTNLPIPAAALTLISSATTNGVVSTVDITLPSGYSSFDLKVAGLQAIGADTELRFKVSIDGGSTFLSGASDYYYLTPLAYGPITSNTSFKVYSNFGLSGTFSISQPSGYFFNMVRNYTGINYQGYMFGENTYSASVQTTSTVNVIRLYTANSAAFRSSGIIKLYGWT